MKLYLLHSFENIPYFNIEGLRQAAGMDNPHQARVLLHHWAEAGHVVPIKKGVYMTRRFADLHSREAGFQGVISAILLPQSYLSLEFVLQRLSILTDITYPVTAVTTRNTRRIENPLGTFWYRSIRPHLYHGFTISEHFGVRHAQASPAKALFDYLYFRPIPAAFHSSPLSLAEEFRLNLEGLSAADQEEFSRFVEASRNRKMQHILENLRSDAWRP